MNKEEFLNSLNNALEKNGISEGKRRRVVRTFEEKIDSVSAEESEALISSFGNPDKIASELKKSLDENRSRAEKEKSQEVKPTQEVSTVEKQEGQVNHTNTARSARGQALFYGGAVLLSPVWLFLIAVAAVVFTSMIAMILGVDVVLTVGMILIGIVLVLLSVAGILSGIIGILPGGMESYIGLYELGLGIMMLGILIVVSILMYHLIVKITPILMKLIAKLVKYTYKLIKKLVIFVRKECDKL